MRVPAALLLVATACGRRAAPAPPESPPARAELLPAPASPRAGDSGGAAAAPLEPAAGGEVVSAATISECPRTLAGAESVNRVITRECGRVVVTADYHVNNGSLTLEAGATLAFAEGVALNVGYNDSGRLIIRGTAEAPVVLTSAGDHEPGAWMGIRLYSHADRSHIDHAIIEYAGVDPGEAVRIDAQDVDLTRTTVRATRGVGVAFGRHGSARSFSGNRFEQIARSPVSLGPSAVNGIDGESQFPPGATIHVYGGTITDEITWRPAGAPYFVSEDIHVEGVEGAAGLLVLAAGVEVRFAPDARLAIGYSSRAILRADGVPFAPVVLRDMGGQPASWPGVVVHARGDATFSSTTFEHGGDPSSASVLRVDGTVAALGCTFRGNVGGVALLPRAKLRAFDGNAFEGNPKGAVALYPRQLDALGPANHYAPGERIVLYGGIVEESATWHAQGATIEVLGNLLVNGRTTLTVAPGARFAMKDGTALIVGQRDNATLRLLGSFDQPVVISGMRDEPGAWAGIHLEQSSRDSVLQHVKLRAATAGVTVADDATAEVRELSCARCAGPALSLACLAKVQAGPVSVDDGPSPAEAREVCP